MTHDRFNEHIFEFVGPRGYILSGRIEKPSTKPHAWAMILDGFLSGGDRQAVAQLARGLTAQGIGVVSFDLADQRARRDMPLNGIVTLSMWRPFLAATRQG
jgi:hypothetical protein